MIYYTGDLHFGHEKVIQLCKRPYYSAGEMDAALIRNWNRKVEDDDTVYIDRRS